MQTTITQRDLRNNNSDIMRRLEDGESFIITRKGKQVGLLTPMKRPQFARMTDVLEAFKGLPEMSYAATSMSSLTKIQHQDSSMSNPNDFTGLDGLIEIVAV
jgi:prevent-host-death family protein